MSKITKVNKGFDKKIKFIDKIDIKDISIFTIISILFFGILINMEFATDTYQVFSIGTRKNVMHFLGCGRFITAISIVLIRLLDLGEGTIYLFSYFLAMFSLIISLYELNKILKEDIQSQLMSRIVSILIILNVFIIELFLFIEKGILIFSILLNILAIKHLIKFLKNKEKKQILFSALYMFIANGSYQGTVGLFLVLAMLYIIKYSKNIKEFICNNLIAVLIYGIPAILDLIIAKIFVGDRVSGSIIIKEAIYKILNSSKEMFNTFTIIPKYIFSIMILVIIGVILYKLVYKVNKNKILNIFYLAYVLLGTYLITVIPQLLQDTNSIWLVPRSTYSYASLIGILILLIYIIYNKQNINKENIKDSKLLIILSIVFICIELICFSKIEVERYKSNQEDFTVTKLILNQINTYEQKNNIKIKKIAIYQDKQLRYSYDNIKSIKDLNIKAYSMNWSTISILEYFRKEKFEVVEKNEEIQNKFLNQNWDNFDQQQLIFNNDTLHLCLY